MTLVDDWEDCSRYPATPSGRHLLLLRGEARCAQISVVIRCSDCGSEHVVRLTIAPPDQAEGITT